MILEGSNASALTRGCLCGCASFPCRGCIVGIVEEEICASPHPSCRRSIALLPRTAASSPYARAVAVAHRLHRPRPSRWFALVPFVHDEWRGNDSCTCRTLPTAIRHVWSAAASHANVHVHRDAVRHGVCVEPEPQHGSARRTPRPWVRGARQPSWRGRSVGRGAKHALTHQRRVAGGIVRRWTASEAARVRAGRRGRRTKPRGGCDARVERRLTERRGPGRARRSRTCIRSARRTRRCARI